MTPDVIKDRMSKELQTTLRAVSRENSQFSIGAATRFGKPAQQ